MTESFEFAAALAATGAQWWLVREAAASTALDRDETHSLDDASTICDRCGRHLPCRHCPPAGDDGLTDEERNERLEQWLATYAARPNPVYEHPHVMDPPEYACAAHWNECPGCRYIGPDKYHDKATSEETR